MLHNSTLYRLKVLYLGGNCLTEIPSNVGLLSRLQALVLAKNQLERYFTHPLQKYVEILILILPLTFIQVYHLRLPI